MLANPRAIKVAAHIQSDAGVDGITLAIETRATGGSANKTAKVLIVAHIVAV